MRNSRQKRDLFTTGVIIALIYGGMLRIALDAAAFLPQSVCFASKTSCLVTFDGLEKGNGFEQSFFRQEESDETAFAGALTQEGTVALKDIGKSQTALLCYTNSGYDRLVNMELVRGNYFIVEAICEHNRAAVISDTLAVELFGTTEDLGQLVEINGEVYEVCGIYKSPGGFLADCCTNGFEQVYLPYRTFSGYGERDCVPDTVYAYSRRERLPQALADEISELTGEDFAYQEITDYQIAKRLLKQNLLFPVFFLFLVLIVRMLLKGVHLWKNERTRKRPLYLCMIFACGILFAGFLLCGVREGIFLPDWLLPKDNIFDIPYYLGQIAARIQTHHSLGKTDFYWNYSLLAQGLTSVGSLMIICCIFLYEIRKKFFFTINKKDK